MNVWLVIVSLLIGFIVGFGWTLCFITYSYEGGQLLIDLKSGVYRIMIDDDIEDWAKQKYVLLKVSTSQQKLKRLKDISEEELNDMSLEKKDIK